MMRKRGQQFPKGDLSKVYSCVSINFHYPTVIGEPVIDFSFFSFTLEGTRLVKPVTEQLALNRRNACLDRRNGPQSMV